MKPTLTPVYQHRSCYINFAEHLQNAWNPNMFYPGAPNRWSAADWQAFLTMIKAFGFNCFEYWLIPSLFDRPALSGTGIYAEFAAAMRAVNDQAHRLGLKTKLICAINCQGPQWRFLCPRKPDERKLIFELWRHWTRALAGTDILTIAPGDPGGCNQNGCNHETFVDLALELSGLIQQTCPGAAVEIGTWGTPFSGWGDDLRSPAGWDGTFAGLTASGASPAVPCPIWNGTPERARRAMEYLIRRLPEFPADTSVAINLGFSPDGDPIMGGDARSYARAIAAIRPITSWDYSLTEDEGVCYPHWRLPRLAARRREERAAAPYRGGMAYTMSPKLNLLTLYAAGRLFLNPDADPDLLAREFFSQIFGAEHAVLGELMEAFAVVDGWGHHPRRHWSRAVLLETYTEIIDRLEAVAAAHCRLPLFPDAETYRRDLLWFARQFRKMAGPDPDREQIRRDYWDRALAIYGSIPRPADPRAELTARRFSQILARDFSFFSTFPTDSIPGV